MRVRHLWGELTRVDVLDARATLATQRVLRCTTSGENNENNADEIGLRATGEATNGPVFAQRSRWR